MQLQHTTAHPTPPPPKHFPLPSPAPRPPPPPSDPTDPHWFLLGGGGAQGKPLSSLYSREIMRKYRYLHWINNILVPLWSLVRIPNRRISLNSPPMHCTCDILCACTPFRASYPGISYTQTQQRGVGGLVPIGVWGLVGGLAPRHRYSQMPNLQPTSASQPFSPLFHLEASGRLQECGEMPTIQSTTLTTVLGAFCTQSALWLSPQLSRPSPLQSTGAVVCRAGGSTGTCLGIYSRAPANRPHQLCWYVTRGA